MLFLRSLIFNVIAYSTLGLGCITASIIGVFSRKATIKMWTYMYLPFLRFCLKYIAGIEIEVRGARYIPANAALYASKHESALATYILSTIVKDMAFVLKIQKM